MEKSLFDAVDFAAMYETQRALCRQKSKSALEWDEKADSMSQKSGFGIYNDFIKSKICIDGAESFLDAGCGTGAFALDFADKFKEVWAFDFSPKMIEKLKEQIKIRGIKNITCQIADIEGSWSGVNVCDIVLASRCLEVRDMKKALKNLNNHAKKAVYLTLKAGRSFLSDELLRVIGREIIPRADYIYAVNILYQMGICAKVDFIPKEDEQCCILPKNADEYLKSITWSLGKLSAIEEKRAREYFEESRRSGKAAAFRNNAWALIYWEK